jgi:putative tryptophan/tyrosine transport system substrate-binding protein
MTASACGLPVSRRQFVQGTGLVSLGWLAGCGQLPGQAQAPTRIPRVGYLMSSVPAASPQVAAFSAGLTELGYVEGQNIVVEYRFAKGREDRLPALAAELVQLPVDAIVTGGPPATLAAHRATHTIPIVQAVGPDLVDIGLAASLARPGGNVTGHSPLRTQLTGKRLELLKETVPTASRVAALGNPGVPGWVDEVSAVRGVAQALELPFYSLQVREEGDLEGAFHAATSERVAALVVLSGTVFMANRARLTSLAAQHRLPATYFQREFVAAGGLMSYGPSNAALHRRAAYYVDRILKGAKPADLPVEQPREFELVINLRTAQALGLTIPQYVLLQATEVMQ